MSCTQCPTTIKQLLKITKTKHKAQVSEKQIGAQIGFFHTLWQRIHDETFDGGNDESREDILVILQDMCHLLLKTTSEIVTPSKVTTGHVEEHTNQAAPNLLAKEETDLNTSKPSNAIISTKSSPQIITIIDKKPLTDTRGKHIDMMKCLPFSGNPPSLSDISIDPITGQFKSMFESQSLNVTLDMLDAVTGEILNSTPYPFMPGTTRKMRTASNFVDTQWDEASLNVIKGMVEADEDYREMIDILANMNTSEEQMQFFSKSIVQESV